MGKKSHTSEPKLSPNFCFSISSSFLSLFAALGVETLEEMGEKVEIEKVIENCFLN
jgi:hypothetical protein